MVSTRRKRATSFFRDLAIATIVVGAVSGCRLLLAPLLYDRAAFLLYGFAVMICSWKGGRRVGLMATSIASLVGALLFVTPFSELTPLQDEVQVVLFALEGAGISVLAGRLHGARDQAQDAALSSTRAHAELSELIESIQDGFQAFDPDFRLTFMNQAASRMVGRSQDRSAALTLWGEFPGMEPSVEQLLRHVMSERVSGACETYYQDRWLAIHANPFRDGMSILFTDISSRKSAEKERERLIDELQDALANIRTLRGLIPICAWCKKIRNDSGYWEQLELYLKNHSEAKFTHGMCPECLTKYSEEPSPQTK